MLTSLVEDDLRAEGIEATIPEMVRARARVAARAGIAGLVCSPHEIEYARAAAPGLFIVVPGIRPAEGAGRRARRSEARRHRDAGDRERRRLPGRGPPDARRARSGQGAFDALVAEVEAAVSASRVVFGVRPVEELCRARPREVVRWSTSPTAIARRRSTAVQAAKERGVTVEFRPRQMVAELAGDVVHQGVVAITGEFAYATVDEILAAAARAGEAPLLLLLDGITDPHNLGALVRSAEVLGAHGVVIPERARRAGDAGRRQGVGRRHRAHAHRARGQPAAHHRRAARARACVLGAAGAGEGERLDQVDLSGPVALVVGAEGKGMREAVARRCDGLFHIPQRGAVSSLNASVAGAIALYEAARQRRAI